MSADHTFPSVEQMAAFESAAASDGDAPIVMLNLNKFRPLASYEDGHVEEGLTGAQAYLRYGAVAVEAIAATGGKIVWLSSTEPPFIGCDHEGYDEVVAVWYPSHAAFLSLTDHPGYTEALAHRDAALERATVIPCAGARTASLPGPFDR